MVNKQGLSENVSQQASKGKIKILNFQKFLELKWIVWIKARLSIFCRLTATHTCHYLVENIFSTSEKIFWFMLFSISSVIAGILLWYSLYLSSDTPTVTVVETTHYPVYKIPFPGVTICSSNKISKKAIMALARELKNPKQNATFNDNLEILKLISGYMDLASSYGSSYKDLDNLLAYNKININYVMSRIMPLCSEIVEKCFWLGTEVRCDAFFKPIDTFQGLCCAFNYIGLKAASKTTSQGSNSILQQVKLVSASGPSSGLIVVLNPLSEDYFYSRFRMTGFRVIIHDSYDFPELNAPNLMIQQGYVSYIGVMPEYTYSKDEIYGKDISIRQCYGEDEIDMNVMKKYSFINCMVECRRLIAYQLCKCIPYNFPKNGTLPTCTATKQTCIMQFNRIINDVNPQINESIGFMPDLPWRKDSCNCLASCKYYQYTAEVSQGKANFNSSVKSQFYLRGFKPGNQSILHVFYTDIVTTVYRRDMFLNWMSVLAMWFYWTFYGTYVFTVRNIFDYLAERSRKIFVKKMKKRESEDYRRKSRIQFDLQENLKY
uniref:CSON006192 protein n=1 Tax=Culicoides sonorensis TaxID=179676 RepID=A0A336LWG6_CULSO